MAALLGNEPNHSILTDSTINTTLSTGRTDIRLSLLPFLSVEPVNNFTVQANSFSFGKVALTFARFHSSRLQLSSFKMAMPSCWKFFLVDDHSYLSCNDNKNSLRYRLQNSLLKC